MSFSKLSFFAMIPANEKLMQNLEGSGAGLGSIMSWGMKNSNNDNIIIMMMMIIIIIIIIITIIIIIIIIITIIIIIIIIEII